ncbi:MAG: BMP family ABC transporter substrate-binding protein [Clostridia bacterium]|nr:BMP family ABC transporter substrate-binding protein [Clostridia bacterium]
MKMIRTAAAALLCAAMLLTAACTAGKQTNPGEAGTTAVTEATTEDLSQYEKYRALSAVILYADDTAAVRAQTDAARASLTGAGYDLIRYAERLSPLAADFGALRVAADEAAKSGANIIIGTDSGYDALFSELAAEYPDILFLCNGGYRARGGNFFEYAVKLYEGFYLAGIAAAAHTSANMLGFVTESGTPQPIQCAIASGFALGARTVNAQTNVLLMPATDTKDAAACIRELAAVGCACVAGNFADHTAYEAAEAENLEIISFGKKGKPAAGNTVIANIYTDISDYLRKIFDAAADGNAQTMDHAFIGIQEHAVGIELYDAKAADLGKLTEEAVSLLTGGRFEIFSGKRLVFDRNALSFHTENAPLTDNNGAEIIPAGGYALEETVLNGYINFYAEGVLLR